MEVTQPANGMNSPLYEAIRCEVGKVWTRQLGEETIDDMTSDILDEISKCVVFLLWTRADIIWKRSDDDGGLRDSTGDDSG